VCGLDASLVVRVCVNACEHAHHSRRRSKCSLGSVLSASCTMQLASLASSVGQPCECCGPALRVLWANLGQLYAAPTAYMCSPQLGDCGGTEWHVWSVCNNFLASAVGQPCECCGPTLASCTRRPQRTCAARSLVTVEVQNGMYGAYATILQRPVFCECEFTCADWECGRPPAHRQRRWHALTVLPLDFHAKGSVSSADASSRHSPPRHSAGPHTHDAQFPK
jgi:hypothetical protein